MASNINFDENNVIITGGLQMNDITSGTTENDILVKNSTGLIKFRSSVSLGGTSGSSGSSGINGVGFSNYTQTDSSSVSGTITLSANTSLNLTTLLNSGHTLVITQGSPNVNIINEWICMFSVGLSVPTITFTPPGSVTYYWLSGTPSLNISKNYLLSILRQTDTMYFAILQSN